MLYHPVVPVDDGISLEPMVSRDSRDSEASAVCWARPKTVAAGWFLAEKSRDRFPDADHKERLNMITSHNVPWPSHVPPSTEFHQKKHNMLLTNVLNDWLAGISISTLTNPSNFRCLPWRAAPLSRWNLSERTWRRGWLHGWSMACDLEL
jgi:hypothetical protein